MVKIIVLGGGFGGIRCAVNLEKKLGKNAEITLIDKKSYHLFVPAIYEVASAFGMKKDPFAVQLKKTVCLPFADIFEGKNVSFIQAEIVDVDLKNQRVITGGAHILGYDYLVFGFGSEAADFNIPGVREYANQFKTLDDALFINQKLEELMEQFKNGQRTEPFSFLIGGAGFTGVELAAELGSCSNVIKNICRLKGRCSAITLFEASPKMLPMLSEKERRIIKERLTKLGIVIMENSPIEEIGPNVVKLKSGQKLEGDLIIWTAGVQANRFLKMVQGLPLTQSGKIPVDSNLNVQGYKNVFAVGDNMEFIDPKTQKPVPALGYVSAYQGKAAADNIYNSIRGKQLKKYTPSYSVSIVPVGGKYAVANFGERVISGFAGWLLKSLADFRYFLNILPFQKAIKIYWDEMTVFTKND